MSWNTDLSGPALAIAEANVRLLRVMAGPGTGKSFAMKRRVMRLLEQGINPEILLAVTFMRTAAASLLKELTELGVPGCEEVQARTLHSFCFSLLTKQEVFEYLGRVARPLVSFSKSGVLQFETAPMLQDIRKLGPFGAGRECTKRVRAFEAAWARLQSDAPGWPHNALDHQFHDVLSEWLRFHEAILVGELVPEALRYLRNNPACADVQAFEHVIVDEYQDLNKAEQVLLDHLTSRGNLAVVGDEDQSIYSFRYAHPQGIVDFADAHAGTRDENLLECRRCGRRIVAIASSLISNNHPGELGPRLQPLAGSAEGEVQVVQWNSLDEEAAGIAAFVEHLIQRRGFTPSEILILSPRRHIGYGVRDATLLRGIPTHSFYHEEALEEDEGQIAFTLLTLLANRDDRAALRFWLGYGSPSWRDGQYRVLRAYCEQIGLSPRAALEQVGAGTLRLKRVEGITQRYRELRGALAPLDGQLGQNLVDSLFPEGRAWARALREAAMLKVKDDTDGPKLLDALQTAVTQPEMPEDGDYVRVMSLHKSKGLTSKAVVIADCIEGLIPTTDGDGTPEERRASLQEQRRLFYVAMTRAREVLVLSSCLRIPRDLAHRMGATVRMGGRTIASRFIAELGPAAPVPVRGADWQALGFL